MIQIYKNLYSNLRLPQQFVLEDIFAHSVTCNSAIFTIFHFIAFLNLFPLPDSENYPSANC